MCKHTKSYMGKIITPSLQSKLNMNFSIKFDSLTNSSNSTLYSII